MLQKNKKDEEGAIALYRKIILVARKEGDEVTEKMFKEILADEEAHHDTFTGLLEDL
jgi:bacterioferritin